MPATGVGCVSGGVSWMVLVFMELTLSSFRTGSNFVSFFLGATMAYLARMELQTQIDELKTSSKRQKIAIIALACLVVFLAQKPYGVITCDGWRVVDKDGKLRISAGTSADGNAGVRWLDKEGKQRISALIYDNGNAGVMLADKDHKLRISASTYADGKAGVGLLDKDGKERISASTDANGKAGVGLLDKDEKLRIDATTLADGSAGVQWLDMDGKLRIDAETAADGNAGELAPLSWTG